MSEFIGVLARWERMEDGRPTGRVLAFVKRGDGRPLRVVWESDDLNRRGSIDDAVNCIRAGLGKSWMPPSVNPEACASCIALSGSKHHGCFKCLLERLGDVRIAIRDGVFLDERAAPYLDTSFLMGPECSRAIGSRIGALAILHNLAVLSSFVRLDRAFVWDAWSAHTEPDAGKDPFEKLPSVSLWNEVDYLRDAEGGSMVCLLTDGSGGAKKRKHTGRLTKNDRSNIISIHGSMERHNGGRVDSQEVCDTYYLRYQKRISPDDVRRVLNSAIHTGKKSRTYANVKK